MNRLSFSPTARRDLGKILNDIARDRPKAAVAFVERIEQKCRMLAESPEMGFLRDELAPGLRAWPVAKYVIFYRETLDGIDIVRVVHGARDLDRLFGEGAGKPLKSDS